MAIAPCAVIWHYLPRRAWLSSPWLPARQRSVLGLGKPSAFSLSIEVMSISVTLYWTSWRFSTPLWNWGSQNGVQYNQPRLFECVQLLLHHCWVPFSWPSCAGAHRGLGAHFPWANQCKKGFKNFSFFLNIVFRSPSQSQISHYTLIQRSWPLCRILQWLKLLLSVTTGVWLEKKDSMTGFSMGE